jgi:hypothetical protein
VIVPCIVLDTAIVVTLNVAVVEPAGTVTLAGTKAGEPFVHKSILMPPEGAGALSVTVPVADIPAVTLVGFTETSDRVALVAGVMVSEAVLLVLL